MGSGHHLLHAENAVMVRHSVGFTQGASTFAKRTKNRRLSLDFYLKAFLGQAVVLVPFFISLTFLRNSAIELR